MDKVILWEKIASDNIILMLPTGPSIGEDYKKSMEVQFCVFFLLINKLVAWLALRIQWGKEDIEREPAPYSACFWAPTVKMRMAGKVVLVRYKVAEYWPKESLTQFAVQLASTDPNGTHSFLSSVILGSEAYTTFFAGLGQGYTAGESNGEKGGATVTEQ